MDNMDINPDQYAQNIEFGAFEIGPDNEQSAVYNMSTTNGCMYKQIVNQLKIGKGQLEKGCSPGSNGKVDWHKCATRHKDSAEITIAN